MFFPFYFETKLFGTILFVSILLSIWSFIWKGLGLWYSARDSKKIWFILILLLNTLGILPIIYIYLIRKKQKKKKK